AGQPRTAAVPDRLRVAALFEHGRAIPGGVAVAGEFAACGLPGWPASGILFLHGPSGPRVLAVSSSTGPPLAPAYCNFSGTVQARADQRRVANPARQVVR